MLLGFGLTCAALTALSFVPLRRPGTLAFFLWFPAWLVAELPWHAAFVAIAGTALLVALGGADAVALGLVGVALVGLVRPAVLAARAGGASAAALAALGGACRPCDWRRAATVLPFAPAELVRVRDVPYALGGGRRHRLDVWRAPDVTPGARRPALLFVHGGGWVIGDKELQGLCTVHELAAAGWVCFSMNYRLSPRAVFPDHLDDVKAALAWIRRHGAEHGADPEMIVLCGASAGGHLASLAALTATEHEPPVQGCVSYYGVYDLRPPYASGAFKQLLERVIFRRRQVDDPGVFEDASPIARVRPDAPPFFVLHGDRDSLVHVDGARRFVERLRAVSRSPVIYAELPGSQHAFELFCSPRSAAAVDGVRRFCVSLEAARRDRVIASAP